MHIEYRITIDSDNDHDAEHARDDIKAAIWDAGDDYDVVIRMEEIDI